MSALVVLSVVAASASVVLSVSDPKQSESFTEFYIKGEDGSYQTEFVTGEARSLTVGITNYEHETVTYTVVVSLQQVSERDNTLAVTDEAQLHSFRSQLDHGEEWQLEHSITPRTSGVDQRIVYRLYRDEPSADGERESAYRRLQLWINVRSSG